MQCEYMSNKKSFGDVMFVKKGLTFLFFFTMVGEISLIQTIYTFISEHINQTTKNIRGRHNIQVNSKKKRLKPTHKIILIGLEYLRFHI